MDRIITDKNGKQTFNSIPGMKVSTEYVYVNCLDLYQLYKNKTNAIDVDL